MMDSRGVLVGDVVTRRGSDGRDVPVAVRCPQPANSLRAVMKECVRGRAKERMQSRERSVGARG